MTLRAFLNANGRAALYTNPDIRAQLKPEMIWEIEQGRDLTTAALHEASLIRTRWYARLARLFRDVDLIALPAAQAWPFDATLRWPDAINGRAMDSYHRWMEVAVPPPSPGCRPWRCRSGLAGRGVGCRWGCSSPGRSAPMPGCCASPTPGTGWKPCRGP